MFLEKQLIFFPSRYPDGDWSTAGAAADRNNRAISIDDCYFHTSDGIRLHGWYCGPETGRTVPAENPAGPLTLLWFHGNAGNISHRRPMIETLLQLPVRIFIIDYRGYGRSDGRPSEAGIYLDARAAWDYLVQKRRISPARIVLFGKSLGSAPAIELATHVQPAGLIIQSAFTSIPDMARIHFPFIPRFFIRTRMDSLSRVGSLSCPKLFIHSKADEIVPYSLSLRLFQAAAEPKLFYEVAGAGHNETWLIGGAAYLNAINRFLIAISQ
jgi:hypothetical protein